MPGDERMYNIVRNIEAWQTKISSAPSANALRVDIAPGNRGDTVQISGYMLTGTTGSGTTAISVLDGAATIDSDTFTIATAKRVQMPSPLPATQGNTLSVLATAATSLTTGILTVLYRIIPA